MFLNILPHSYLNKIHQNNIVIIFQLNLCFRDICFDIWFKIILIQFFIWTVEASQIISKHFTIFIYYTWIIINRRKFISSGPTSRKRCIIKRVIVTKQFKRILDCLLLSPYFFCCLLLSLETKEGKLRKNKTEEKKGDNRRKNEKRGD